eukprot:UN08231
MNQWPSSHHPIFKSLPTFRSLCCWCLLLSMSFGP